MKIIVLKIFLVVTLLMVFARPILIYGRRHPLFSSRQVKALEPTALTNRIYALWMMLYLLWGFLVILYRFKPESVGWFWKISLLNHDFVKIFAIVTTCLGCYPLMELGVLYKRKLFRSAVIKGEASLVTTGIFRYSRNPVYLSIDIGVLATFLIMPNLLSLLMAGSMIAVNYAECKDKDKRLQKLYGKEYEKYQKHVGMIFPKMRR